MGIMIDKYRMLKAQNPDVVLWIKMGDFYELFDEDAKLAHRTLGITLTSRGDGVPMAGVPYHSIDSYLSRMLEAGHRCALIDEEYVEQRSLLDALRQCFDDLQHYADMHGPGPDRRLAELCSAYRRHFAELKQVHDSVKHAVDTGLIGDRVSVMLDCINGKLKPIERMQA